MNTPNQTAGGAWRTIREAIGAVVGNPLGCLALGTAFLGVGGILHESAEFKKTESERAAWSRPGVQDFRDALRDESNVRTVRVPQPEARKARAAQREKALRADVGAALATALSDLKQK